MSMSLSRSPMKLACSYQIGSPAIGAKAMPSNTDLRLLPIALQITMLPRSKNAKLNHQTSIGGHRMACRTLPTPWSLLNGPSLIFSRWMEFRKYHRKHKGGPAASSSTSTSTTDDSTTTEDSTTTGTNSTKVKMVKFRD